MVSFKSIAVASAVAGVVVAKDVACLVNGAQVAVVDLDTGDCPFTIPASFPAKWDFTSPEDYSAEFYYTTANAKKYFTDIVNAGKVISAPASAFYGKGSVPIFQVIDSKTPASNSTAAIRKRLMKEESLLPRDAASSFAATLEGLEGVEQKGLDVAVVDLSDVTSTASTSSAAATTDASDLTSTVTDKHTTIVTITSCSDNKCHETTVPATPSLVTVTTDDVVTVSTTWCPVSEDSTATVTDKHTTIVTITSCSDNKCHETTVPATPSLVTVTTDEVVTVSTTWCPVTEAPAASTATPATEGPDVTATEYSTTLVTITSCSDNKCHETTVPATPSLVTVTTDDVVTVSTTWCPVTEAPATTTATPATEAPAVTTATPETEAPAVTTATPATEAETATDSTSTVYITATTNGKTTVYPTTVPHKSTLASSTVAPSSTGAAPVTIPASDNGARATKASLLAFIAIPLAYFL
ncbi:yeast-form wall Protein 1 [[Candida] anglica]|uniref:Yeast-form wall Protein 1 n=1 Tax=[Candida] anglica TaxID=148631 RepID=A0ABP0E7U7_9ASCO